jgi:Tol biopolymer transport system component
MDDSSPNPPTPAGADRLDSWKEIAAYLRRDVTTVQRWEKREGMPVRRHVHDKLGSVYAFRSELDQWALARHLAQPPVEATEAVPEPSALRRPRIWVFVSAAAAVAIVLAVAWWSLERSDYFWRSPVDGARFENLTDFGGGDQSAALSRDGRFVAYLSDRDGPTDVWVTQVGAGQSYNLTHGRFRGLGNPSVRNLGFSPDGALVTFWARGLDGTNASEISVWAVPTLGGQPRPYVDGAAELDWSSDGSRLVYHTPGPGDPMFIRVPGQQTPGPQIFAAAAGLHAHFPLWSPDGRFIYFVQGSVPDAMDVWRISPDGHSAERITHHNARISHPVLLNDRTLMYLVGDKGGSGPWLYAIDVDHRIPHRVSGALDRYTSLAVGADGQRLIVTLAKPKGTLWRLPVGAAPATLAAATPISLTTARGSSPRLGPGYLLYVASNGASEGIWKLADNAATELWSAPDARIIGGPEVAPNGRGVAFSVEQRGMKQLLIMNDDGTNARVVTQSLDLDGDPAWSPDGRTIASGADVQGTPHLFRITIDGAATSLGGDYAIEPAWSPRGDFLVYSGADIGTTFSVMAIGADASPHAFPSLSLTRGARRVRFLPGHGAIVVMRGDLQHKNLWLIDLEGGAERQLTDLPLDFNIRDFDVSSDGREIVLEQVQEESQIVLIDRARN